MSTSRKRYRQWLAGLMAVAVISAVGVLALVIQAGAVAEAPLAPRYTPAPDAGLRADTAGPDPSAGPAAAASPAPGSLEAAIRGLRSGLAPAEITDVAAAAPVAPSAPTTAPAGPVRLFLPLAQRDYTPPPRALEPFLALPAPAADDWPAAAPALSASRIGLHTLGPSDPAIMELIRRGRPRVVKAVGDFGWLAEVKQVSPGTVTLGRVYGQDESWVNALDPAEAAALYIQQHEAQYRLNPAVDYWEGWNEFVYGRPEQLRWFAAFEAARACQMRALGYRAAVGGFAVGWPNTYAEMELFLPALEAAGHCDGLFHLHEYNKPLLQCGVRGGEANVIPGAPALREPAGPLTFRYRFWYAGYLRPRGLGDLPLVLSEYGIDGVPAIGCADPLADGGRTWKDYSGWWESAGWGATGPQAYVNQLAWADREMRHDAYLLGAVVFTAGAVDGANQWNPYDLHDVLLPLAHYLVTQSQ